MMDPRADLIDRATLRTRKDVIAVRRSRVPVVNLPRFQDERFGAQHASVKDLDLRCAVLSPGQAGERNP